MDRKTRYLLLGMCGPMLAAPLAAQKAHAFDTVAWQWRSNIAETVVKTAVIDINLSPVGMLFVEQHQIFKGDLSAISTVDGVSNTGTSVIATEDFIETTSEMLFVDVDFDARLQIGAGNNGGANPMGAARYNRDGGFSESSIAGAQSHLALYAMLQNNPDSIDYEKSFVDEATGNFEIVAYFDDLDLHLEVKGTYDDCTPGGAGCTPTGSVELYRLSDDQKVFLATGTLNQQTGLDMVNTAGPGGHVKLSAEFDGALEWREVLTEIVSQRQVLIPTIADAVTELPGVTSVATAAANNSGIEGGSALQLDISQLAWGAETEQEAADVSARLGCGD